jgi:hypothetical protein
MNKSIVADAVAVSPAVFTLSADLSERVAVAAEMAVDSQFDFRKSCDSVAYVLGAVKADGVLTFDSWEVVRKRFEEVATVRSRDNGAADPEGAANDCWLRVAAFIKEYHGLAKPKAENPDAKRMADKREVEKAKALEAAKGKTAAELEAAKRELYSQATDDAIAQAKAIEKVIKVVQSVEKDAVSAQMKPLMAAANDGHKAIMEFMKGKNDPKILGDYVVLLKRTLDIWKEAK